MKHLFIFLFSIFSLSSFAQDETQETIEPTCDYYAEKGISVNKKAVKVYWKAKALYDKRNIKEAKAAFKEAVELDEDFAHAKMMMGDIAFYSKNYKSAKKWYEEVIAICPDFHPKLYIRLTKAQLSLKYIEDPLVVYGACVQHTEKYLEIADPKKRDYEKMSKQNKDCKNYVAIYSNPVQFEPKPISGLESLGSDEYMPIISPDNELLYYTKRVKKIIRGGAYERKVWEEKFYVAHQTDEGYSDEEEMDRPFNQGMNQGAASLSIDNKEMFITICEGTNKFGSPDCNIYYTERHDTGWTNFVNMNAIADVTINTPYWESQPCISPDGKYLYYVSDSHDESTIKAVFDGNTRVIPEIDTDIYRVERKENGRWGNLEKLGPNINTEFNEESPFLHQDNQTFYFGSSGHLNVGDNTLDIFISRKQKGGSWGPAINLGVPINTPGKEADFFVSTDGKKGYYSAKLDGAAMWDVFEFDLYERARPKELIMRKGTVTDEEGNVVKNAKIKLRNNLTDEEKEINVDAESGEYVFIETIDQELEEEQDADDLYAEMYAQSEEEKAETSNSNDSTITDSTSASATPKEETKKKEDKPEFNYNLTVQKEGHFFESTNISDEDPKALGVESNDFEMNKVKKGASFKINNLLFATDSYDLSVRSKNEIRALADFMKLNDGIKISVNGHTDNVGNATKNTTLSSNRAKSVYDYLIELNVPASRLSYKGYGSKKPIASNSTEEGRAKNRRTEVVIL